MAMNSLNPKGDIFMEKIFFSGSSVFFDDKELKFPASYKEMVAVLGEPDRVYDEKYVDKTTYIYDELGISFERSGSPAKRLKYLKKYIDDEHCLIHFALFFRDKSQSEHYCEDVNPMGLCKAELFGDKDILGNEKPSELDFIFSKARAGDFSVIAWCNGMEHFNGFTHRPEWNCTVSYDPPEPEDLVKSYKIKKCKEEVLEFSDVNFKLAVVQQLMYEKELLKPKFDIFRFAELYDGKEIDTESDTIIKPALNWFKKLPIPKRLAAEIETIRSDGGDDVYMNIIPQWDGEDKVFYIKSVTPEEIKQFPNLKSVSIFAGDEVLEVFRSCGIEVE